MTDSKSQVFSGTFKGQQTTEGDAAAPPALQLQYAGPTTGIQVRQAWRHAQIMTSIHGSQSRFAQLSITLTLFWQTILHTSADFVATALKIRPSKFADRYNFKLTVV